MEVGKNNISFSDREYYFSIIQLTSEIYRSTVPSKVAAAFFSISCVVYIVPFRFAALTLMRASVRVTATRRISRPVRSGLVRSVNGCRRAR